MGPRPRAGLQAGPGLGAAERPGLFWVPRAEEEGLRLQCLSAPSSGFGAILGGGDGGLQVGCRARLLPQHLQGWLVSSPLLPWNAESRPCRRGLGAAPGGAWTPAQLRGGVALGTCCKLSPRAVRGLRPGVGAPSRPACIGRPSGWGDELAWAPPTPCRASGQGQAGGRRPVSHEPGDNKQRHLIYMTKCRHYCRLTESR